MASRNFERTNPIPTEVNEQRNIARFSTRDTASHTVRRYVPEPPTFLREHRSRTNEDGQAANGAPVFGTFPQREEAGTGYSGRVSRRDTLNFGANRHPSENTDMAATEEQPRKFRATIPQRSSETPVDSPDPYDEYDGYDDDDKSRWERFMDYIHERKKKREERAERKSKKHDEKKARKEKKRKEKEDRKTSASYTQMGVGGEKSLSKKQTVRTICKIAFSPIIWVIIAMLLENSPEFAATHPVIAEFANFAGDLIEGFWHGVIGSIVVLCRAIGTLFAEGFSEFFNEFGEISGKWSTLVEAVKNFWYFIISL